MKEIIFLNRSYNDMDIQISLIDAFANDPDFKVRVIGYPCDGYIGAPASHEGAAYLLSKGVSLETVMDSPHVPCHLKLLRKMESVFRALRKKTGNIPVISFIFKIPHLIVFRSLFHIFKRPHEWVARAALEWKADIIVLDEASAQSARSQIIADVLPELAKNGTKIYTVLTGQNPYYDPFPTGAKPPAYTPSVSTRNFVPSEHDKYLYSILYPGEKAEIAGNLRMNEAWIKKLHSEVLAPPFYNKTPDLEKLPQGNVRVVFMLSKMSYGIKDEQIFIDAIARVGRMPGVAMAIKPHTRGMKLDFLDPKNAGNAIDASDIPSTVLVDWADVLFFTGSGIAFHSMFLGKKVGFLKYCQKLDTIFDDSQSVDVLNSAEEVEAYVSQKDPSDARKAQARQWLRDNVEGGSMTGEVAAEYKRRILSDL